MNILIVDDEVKILEVIAAYLKKDGYNVFLATNGLEAMEIYITEKIDLILLDLMLPGISGEKICKNIRQESNIPIIMITAKTDDDERIKGLDSGADDYISKPFNVKEVVARVNALIRRSYDKFDTNLISFNNGELKVNLKNREVVVRGEYITLTVTEFSLLNIFIHNGKKIFTRDELIQKLSGNDSDIYDRAIDSHIKNLRQKVEENTKKPLFITTVYGVGYKFDGKKD